MRGTVLLCARVGSNQRFIPRVQDKIGVRLLLEWVHPACAGHTGFGGSANRRWSGHPRMCGAYGQILVKRVMPCGSSPHVRGIQSDSCGVRHPLRFIPACAGHTALQKRCKRGDAVHPRMCGAYFSLPSSPPERFGSSPHVRGILQHIEMVKPETTTYCGLRCARDLVCQRAAGSSTYPS